MSNIHPLGRAGRAVCTVGLTVGTLLATAVGGTATASAQRAPRLPYAGKVLTVLAPAAAAGAAAQYNAYYAAIAKQFHVQTGATVKWDLFSSSSQESSIIQTAIVSGSGPDLINYGSGFAGTFYATGDFVQYTPSDWNAVGGRSSFIQAMLAQAGPDANHDIGIPMLDVPYVIAYNKTLFAKAGITSPPTTWTQWVEDAQKIQKADPHVYGAGFDPADSFDPWKFLWSYSAQLGGGFLSPNGKKATFTSKPMEEAMDFYFAQYYKYHIVPPGSLTWDDGQMVSAFLKGQVAMLPIANESTLREAAGTPIAKDIAFAPLPNVPYGMSKRPHGGTAAESIVGTLYWGVPKYAASTMPLALQLVKASISPEVDIKMYQLAGWFPVTKSGLSLIAKKFPSTKLFLKIISESQPYGFTPAWSAIETGLGTVVNSLASHLATTGAWSQSYMDSQLATLNATVQSQLGA